MTRTDELEVERFHATSGRLTGWLATLVALGVGAAGMTYLDEGFPLWVISTAVLVAVLSWAVMLRPALWVRGEHLVMRNMAETVHIRLAAVEEMALRQMLAVRAADTRFVSTVVGRSWHRTVKTGRPGRTVEQGARSSKTVNYADFVEERLRHLVEQARDRAGVRAGSREQMALPDAVRRKREWVPIALICSAVLVVVVTIFV